MSDADKHHGGVAVDHTRQLARLSRIQGQVRGLQVMIESRRPCLDVTYQIEAVIAALRRVEADMLRDHLQAQVRGVLTGELAPEARTRLADEIATLIGKLT